MKIRCHYLIQAIVVAVAIVAVAVPMAGAGQLAAPQAAQVDSRRSAQSAIELLQLQERARRVALCEGLEACIRQLRPAAAAPTVTIVEPSPFDWGDAGVGAAGAFGLMLLAFGVTIVSRDGRATPA